MHINVVELKKAIGDTKHYQLEENLSPVKLNGDTIKFVEPVKVSLDVTNAGTYLEVKGTITTVVQLNCGRCLKPYNYAVETEFNEHYYSAEVEKAGFEDDNDERIPFTGDFIDIDQEVINAVQLSLPMRQICSEECKGLCPQCGVNLNNEQCDCQEESIDPRMAVLQELFKKK